MKQRQEGQAADLRELEDPNLASVEVMVLWQTNVLFVQHFTPPRAFYIGEDRSPDGACDYVVPAGPWGTMRAPIVLTDGGSIRCVILPGASGTLDIPGQATLDLSDAIRTGRATACSALPNSHEMMLPAGARARIEANGLVFQVTAVAAGRPVPTGVFATSYSRRLLFGGSSLMAHLCVLGSLAFLAPRESTSEDESQRRDRLQLIQRYLDSATEREAEQKAAESVGQSDTNAREGGQGTHGKGEEGSLGVPNSKENARRYGVKGPGDRPDPHVARAAAFREASEFGMIGLLGQGNMWGDTIGDSFGEGGLGLSGIGEGGGGGGGRGEGISVGPIGRLGHGSGAGFATGFGLGHGSGAGFATGFGSGHGRLGGKPHDTRTQAGAQAGKRLPARPLPWASPSTGSPSETAESAESAASAESVESAESAGYRERTTATEGSAARTAIDPNGRFSTTYRPGHGHLAAFEAAVARGIVPAAARELVSDVGARYAPNLPEPEGKALGYAVDLERTALPPDGGTVHMRISLRSSGAETREHPRRAVSLVLDVSGSMQGEPLTRAKEAAKHLVDRLASTDDFSLITFSDAAHVAVPNGPVGPRREAIRRAIEQAAEGGGTNIGEALQVAYRQAHGSAGGTAGVVPVVMLLSDGQPTVGERNERVLSSAALEAFQNGIQTSTFGLGAQFDGLLMSSLASGGAGGYYYLRDADQIAPAFRGELEQRLDPAASAVEIRVRLDPDVSLLHVYGSSRLSAPDAARERAKEVAADQQAAVRQGIRRDRLEDPKGGMRFFIPAFARNDSYSLLVQVAVPAGTATRSLGMLELKYKDQAHRRNVSEENRILASFAANDADSARSLDPSVMRTVQGHLAGEDLMSASKFIAAGESSQAIALLGERESILRTAAISLHEPGFLTDATRFSRLLSHTQGGELRTQPHALAMVLETAARSHLQ